MLAGQGQSLPTHCLYRWAHHRCLQRRESTYPGLARCPQVVYADLAGKDGLGLATTTDGQHGRWSQALLSGQNHRGGATMLYDLLIRGGRVIDPAQGIDGLFDVAVQEGRIAAVQASISSDSAKHVVDV